MGPGVPHHTRRTVTAAAERHRGCLQRVHRRWMERQRCCQRAVTMAVVAAPGTVRGTGRRILGVGRSCRRWRCSRRMRVRPEFRRDCSCQVLEQRVRLDCSCQVLEQRVRLDCSCQVLEQRVHLDCIHQQLEQRVQLDCIHQQLEQRVQLDCSCQVLGQLVH